MRAPIFLIGYMGAGKTTIGKIIARCLNFVFIDLDNYIENRHHQSVSSIFSTHGEGEFRLIEHNILHEVGMFESVVVSTGGGAPCFFDNMEFMNSVGLTVYLKASANELVKRLKAQEWKRPLLMERKDGELLDFVSDSLKKRNEFYMQAQLILEIDGMDIESVVNSLIDLLETNKNRL
jgi:shikimate kinase